MNKMPNELKLSPFGDTGTGHVDGALPVYIGRGCNALIVEPDDTIADQFANSLRRFRAATTQRARTPQEALEILADPDTDEIHQVCIDGRVWTISQAMSVLRSMVRR